MQATSALYHELLTGNYTVETRVSVGDSGLLIDKGGDYITFGGVRILVAASGADGGYGESMLADVSTSGGIFSGSEPTVGECISRECNIKMLKPVGTIAGLSRISIYPGLQTVSGTQSGCNRAHFLPIPSMRTRTRMM